MGCTYLTNTIQRSARGGDAALCLISFTFCLVVAASSAETRLKTKLFHDEDGIVNFPLHNAGETLTVDVAFKLLKVIHMVSSWSLHRIPQKETPYSWWYLCQIFTDSPNSVTVWFSGNFAVKWLLKITPYLAYVATLPCGTLMSENKRLTIIMPPP